MPQLMNQPKRMYISYRPSMKSYKFSLLLKILNYTLHYQMLKVGKMQKQILVNFLN
ncbi:unnamed protein product [Paramecium octaurelia]|uniref:Uncharacterized protein n=1 Tax=Paramecium octaurelia TaxID=43137 RepID=A0A8S1X8V4_PAROT|nr:unnamed protein product [Paramecium octaurelia]